ncbi:carbamoyltransferase [Actinomadura harenae]|uniref:Carbamoyltransferase n=1 Tax=Actinomadura harenae TaxID=2483351 RepID=A0A3M2LA04_9ACTN|nr:carbamoyltransferase [Actinomadura harenae]
MSPFSRLATHQAPVVLGLCSGTHDSSAALIADGTLVGLVEEERLNGDKHTRAYPRQAVTWLLDQAGLKPAQVTHVAYNHSPLRYLAAAPASLRWLAHPAAVPRAFPRARSCTQVWLNSRARMRAFQTHFPAAHVTAVEHHLTHALYALAAGTNILGGRNEVAVLVTDSLGETATTTITHARLRPGGRVDLDRRLTLTDPASLGYVYGAVTLHLGWRRTDEEGTVMALAALGDPARFRDLFRRAIPITSTGFGVDVRLFPLRVLSSRWPRVSPAFAAETCPPRAPGAPVEQVHADLAAALQERTEQVMVHLARRARKLTGARVLAVGGGVAMNCVSIGKICEQAGFEQVTVPPSPGDAGTSAGAALAVHRAVTGRLPAGVAGASYLGPDYPSMDLPVHPRPGLTAIQVASPEMMLARRLAEGQIVGLFRGRLEAGPRALGHRSILASPLLPGVVERLNARIKYREEFRPFAPMVLASVADDYFTLGQPSPFMSMASGVTDLTREAMPSIVHVNGTARVQTVNPDAEPFVARVLAAFAAITGHPVLINTSLNVKGQPICGTPDMALDCLTGTGMDALLLEDWWVAKTTAAPLGDSEPGTTSKEES